MYSEKERERQLKYYRENKEKRIAYRLEWAKKNPEKTKESKKRHYLKHREEILKKRKEYVRANPEKIKMGAHKYYINNKETHNERNKMWAKLNPGKMAFQYKKRQTQKQRALAKWANLKEIKKIYVEAARISKETGIKHNVDHIYPLISPVCCGLHVESNLRIITEEENKKKSNKMPDFTEVKL